MIGYFGKIPSHGDFVSRGLPADLVAAWDQWLQASILESQKQLGDRWLAHYLTSPVWRFAISPGILGPEGLGGVMMPSVDRVGRYFPLMIGATGALPLLDWFQKRAAWYDEIEALARAALDTGFRLEQFGLVRQPVPDSADLPASALHGQSVWWTADSSSAGTSMLMCPRLPAAERFAALLDGACDTQPPH